MESFSCITISFFNNTLTSWNKDENNLKASADVNWQKFYH